MAWQELIESIEERMRGELDEMLKSAEDKKKRILSAAETSAREAQEKDKKESLRAAQLLHDEVISGGRIESKNILRKSHLHEINAVYDEFKVRLLETPSLKKKILVNFIEKNVPAEAVVELSAETAVLLKGARFSKKIKLIKKDTALPVFINMDKIVVTFDWDEFLEAFKTATIRKVSMIGTVLDSVTVAKGNK